MRCLLRVRLLGGLCCGVSTLAPLASTTAADRYEVEVKDNIKYGKGADQELMLTLARPKVEKDEARPCLVFIHGGGWQGGNRQSNDAAIREAAARGYVAVTVTYRLAPKYRYPAAIEDAKCSVRYLRAHADELHIKKDKIGAIGFSAGAHLAMMLGVMDDKDGLDGNGGWQDQSSKVQAVVSYFGPTNLLSKYPDASQKILETFFEGNQQAKHENYVKASPITYVNRGDAPMLLLQGTADELVPYDQAVQMAAKLTEAGVPGRVEILLGAHHGWGGKEMERTIKETFEFLDSNLK